MKTIEFQLTASPILQNQYNGSTDLQRLNKKNAILT